MKIRESAVAGSFYPNDADLLGAHLASMLLGEFVENQTTPRALIVPHAGYQYSGSIASSAYAWLRKKNSVFNTVVIFGPSHKVPVKGCVTCTADIFDTPLGQVKVDRALISKLIDRQLLTSNDEAHEHEHSIEVQLPFLQVCLNDFQIVPVVVGESAAETISNIISFLGMRNDVLFIISSDMSHYLGYESAKQVDSQSIRQILSGNFELNFNQACGAECINGLMFIVREHGLNIQLVNAANSGDSGGDKEKVVGYASFVIY